MNAPYIQTRSALSRRHFLRGVGTCISLPFLEAMVPRLGAANAGVAPESIKRFVAINASLGFHAPYLFPEKEGADYKASLYLEKLKDHRGDLTLFSGLSHPEQSGNDGHASEKTWLTSAQRPGLAGFRNTVSLDQLMARHLHGKTRVPFLSVSTGFGGSLSWTETGVQIPAENEPSRVFKQLFINGTEKEMKEEMAQLKRGASILDAVRGDARALQGNLGAGDRDKLEEYFSSIRDLEDSIRQSEIWARRPKPEVNESAPPEIQDKNDVFARQRQFYHVLALALQTDSTRVATFTLSAMGSVPSHVAGVKQDWHNLSHHGKDQEKIDELRLIEEVQMTAYGEFLTRLKNTREGEGSLLDQTAILLGSNLGNAASHDWRNLPILVAGGGYRHGAYVAHNEADNTPLANLFVSLAQRMGVEVESFGSSTKAGLRGLEVG